MSRAIVRAEEGKGESKKDDLLEWDGRSASEWAGLMETSADGLNLITQLYNPGGGRPFRGNQGDPP